MKYILTEDIIDIPYKVEVKTYQRNIEVKGPLGILKKTYKRVGVDIQSVTKRNKRGLILQVWNTGSK